MSTKSSLGTRRRVHLLGRLVDVLHGHGCHSVDDQARLLAECAVTLGGVAAVMAIMDAQGKLHLFDRQTPGAGAGR